MSPRKKLAGWAKEALQNELGVTGDAKAKQPWFPDSPERDHLERVLYALSIAIGYVGADKIVQDYLDGTPVISRIGRHGLWHFDGSHLRDEAAEGRIDVRRSPLPDRADGVGSTVDRRRRIHRYGVHPEPQIAACAYCKRDYLIPGHTEKGGPETWLRNWKRRSARYSRRS